MCLQQLDNPTTLYRQWLALCLGRTWRNFEAAKKHAVELNAHDKLYPLLLWDETPEVRTAAVFALGTYLSSGPGDRLTERMLSINAKIGVTLLSLVTDGSPVVRKVSSGHFGLVSRAWPCKTRRRGGEGEGEERGRSRWEGREE